MADNKKKRNATENIEELSKEALCEKVQALEAHVIQLKNLLNKAKEGPTKNKKPWKERPFDFSKYNTRHVALKITYLGWDYQGFASQEDTNKTIEYVLFEALRRTKLVESRETSNYYRCGRTDKGVSAFSQVISLDLRTNLLEGVRLIQRENSSEADRPGDKTTEIRYCHILNKVLPAEIRVLAWCPVPSDFSARFSCKQRTYKYFFPGANLNLKSMRAAAQKLHGEQDFRNLCKMDVANGVTNFTRKILSTSIDVLHNSNHGYDMCELTVIGQAFLWHQIRCIVAVLFLVGQGKESPEIMDELLNVKKNPCKPQYAMAAELPLVLFDCEFEDVDWIYELDWHEENIKHLQSEWTTHSIRATMVKRMLEHLEGVTVRKYNAETKEEERLPWSECSSRIYHQVEDLIPGNKPRSYRPLLDREKCESLEDRIEHFTKKRKLAPTSANSASTSTISEPSSANSVPASADSVPLVQGSGS